MCRTKLDLNKNFKEVTKAIEVAQVQIILMAGDHKILVSISNKKNIDDSIKNLEVQLSKYGSGSFSTTTQVNPKKHCNLITTRWGTVVGLKNNDEKKNKQGVEKENKKHDEVVTSEKVALEEMPTYAKFMKDFLMKKKRIMDDEIVKPQPQQ
ncbi:hypothetical protein HKD37_14G040187 [Glycine soja]